MASTDIRFKIRIDNVNKTLKFTDTTDYTTTEGTDNISGLLKIVDPIGNVVYENTGFSTDSFYFPDTIYKMSKNEVADIAMSLLDGNILSGEYTIYYKVAKSTLTSVSYDVIADGTISTFTIVGGVASDLLSGGYLDILGGTNAGTYSVKSYTESGGNLTVVVNETITTDPSTTTSVSTVSKIDILSTDKTFKWDYTPADVSISYSLSCDSAVLTSIDDTVYTVTICDSTITPESIVRTHSVSPPKDSGYPAPIDTASATRTFTDIYTKVWQTTIVTDVSYMVEKWDTLDWYYIDDTVKGADSIDVQCNQCNCDIKSCIVELYNKWLNYLGVNKTLADRLHNDITKVNNLYIQYLQAVECGDSTTDICNDLSNILKTNDCSCSTDTDDYPVKVEPSKKYELGISEFLETVPLSFESGEKGILTLDVLAYPIEKISFTCIGDIETSDTADIQVRDASVIYGDLYTSGSYGDDLGDVVIGKQLTTLIIETTKKTAGGRVLATIHYKKN